MKPVAWIAQAEMSDQHESCRVCGSDEVIFNRRMVQGKEIRVRFCNACGAIDRL